MGERLNVYTDRVGNSVTIRTPIPSADEVADNLGLSKARREFLSELASTVKVKRSPSGEHSTGMAQRAKSRRKRSTKKAA